MPKKPLLLLPAKQKSLLADASHLHWIRLAAIVIGLFVVLVGAADLTTRLARATLGDDALFVAFAPAVLQQSAGVPATSTASVLTPARLKVPALGIDANVEEVGRKADGSMGTPKNFMDAGWWSLGGKPGEAGNAVFDGHVNNALTASGVFEHLSQIHIGDYITVSDAAGKTIVYKVSEVDLYPTDQAPAASIFATTGPSQIVLITCEGEWVQDAHSFDKRLVVVAKPAY
jgi:sortase (surface protein transpeptidase)